MIDRYTKSVLTIIAAALTVLALREMLPPAIAQSGLVRVQICDPEHCAAVTKPNIIGSWGLRVDAD